MTNTNQITLTSGERIIQTDKGEIKVKSKAGKTLSVTANNLGDISKMIEIMEFEDHLDKSTPQES